MNRTSLYIIILFAVLLMGVEGCEKKIEIEIDEISPRIVLNALLEADSTVEVSLSRTRHILDNKEITALTTGRVEIFDSRGNSQVLSLINSKYVSDNFKINAGEEYRITASADGFYDVEAVCFIPEAVEIIRIDTFAIYNEWNEPLLSLGIVFQDDPDVDNYYQLNLISKSSYSDWYIDNHYDTLYYDPVKDTVIMGIVLDTIENHHTYWENTYFNTDDLIIEESDYNGGLVFSDYLIQGKEYSLNGNIYTYAIMGSADTARIYIQLNSISKDYFEYFASKQKHYSAKGDPFSTPVVVHTNIENGLGIFGGSSSSVDSLLFAPRPYKEYPWGYK